jgi:hypothetical protein
MTTSQIQYGRVSGNRTMIGGVLLTVALAAVLVAGGWGLISSLYAEAPPARVGETVEVSGGLMRVDGVTQERMAPMQSSKFSAGGMNMSSMGVDMAPEGQRRFAVSVTLAAGEDADFAYSAEDFRVSGPGLEASGPIRHQLPSGTVPTGRSVSGNLVYQVPNDAHGLKLSFDGGRPVALDLPPAEDGGQHHH